MTSFARELLRAALQKKKHIFTDVNDERNLSTEELEERKRKFDLLSKALDS